MAINTTITETSDAPSRADPANFITRADAFLASLEVLSGELATLIPEINAESATINSNTVAAVNSALAAAADAALAATHAVTAQAAADAVQSAAGFPSLAGNGLLVMRVNAAENGVEWGLAFPDLGGEAGQSLIVNQGEDGVIWGTPFPEFTNNEGKVLAVNGAANGVEYIHGGAMTPIGAKVIASNDAYIDFSLPSGYDNFVLLANNLVPAETSDLLYIRLSNDGGTTVIASSGYRTGTTNLNQLTVCTTVDGAGAAYGLGYSGEINIRSARSATKPTLISAHGSYESTSAAIVMYENHGIRNVAEDNDLIRLYFNTGNIATGELQLYGVKHA